MTYEQCIRKAMAECGASAESIERVVGIVRMTTKDGDDEIPPGQEAQYLKEAREKFAQGTSTWDN